MKNDLQIYLLDPQKYSQETIAVAFAKTSRSPETFRQIASELNEAKSAEFNEKWVVGYGHSSVAEHAVLHIAVENISRLATECLESNRLASYTEKSTRYQTWDADAFYTPQELANSTLKGDYTDMCRRLLETYLRFIPLVGAAIKITDMQKTNESDSAYERRIRSQTIDVCRFILPASVLANVGMTINARALEHAIAKMLSHPLQEVRAIGQDIKSCCTAQIPTLLKYANAEEYLECSDKNFVEPGLPEYKGNGWCQLVNADPGAEERILAACLYRYNNISFEQALKYARSADMGTKAELAKKLLSCENRHFTPLRELEHANFTFEIVIDQGAYYELKRHRMMTLTPQALTTHLGYAIPRAIEAAGLTTEYCDLMNAADKTYKMIAAENPQAASYMVPNAYNRSCLVSSNLRSLLHFIKLRSAANAHFSIRRIAQQLSHELQSELPLFAPYLVPETDENVDSITTDYFLDVNRG
jgi:thymidylate synthase ThyX